MSIYTEEGYDNRLHYLKCLAEENGITLKEVKEISEWLGKEEDFDALPIEVEDYAEEKRMEEEEENEE